MIHWKELFVPQESMIVSFLMLGSGGYPPGLNNKISIENWQINTDELIYTEDTIGNRIENVLNSFESVFDLPILTYKFLNDSDLMQFNYGKEQHFNRFLYEYKNKINYNNYPINMRYKNCFWYSNKNGIVGDQPIIVIKQNKSYGVIKHPYFNSYGMCINNLNEKYESLNTIQELII
jgi:hypothetical protein